MNKDLDGVGLEGIKEVEKKTEQALADVTPGSDLYRDWERTNAYKLERGEGECAV